MMDDDARCSRPCYGARAAHVRRRGRCGLDVPRAGGRRGAGSSGSACLGRARPREARARTPGPAARGQRRAAREARDVAECGALP
jgi:hypothetical protein